MDQIPPEVRAYLEGLITDSGMTLADDEMKEEMVKELYMRLDNYLASIIVDYLPEDQFEEFVKMNDEGKPKNEIENFLKEKLPDSKNVFAKAFADFRQMYLGGVAAAKNSPQTPDQNSTKAN